MWRFIQTCKKQVRISTTIDENGHPKPVVIGLDFAALAAFAQAMGVDMDWLAEMLPAVEYYLTCYHNGVQLGPENSD